MAVYRVQGPDGKIHRFEGPDGASPQEVEAFAAQQFGGKRAAPPAPTAQGAPSDSFWENAAAGTGKAIFDAGRGIRQLASKVGIGDEKAIQAEIDEAKRLDAPLMDTGGGLVGNIFGNVGMAVAPGGGLGAAAMFAHRLDMLRKYAPALMQGAKVAATPSTVKSAAAVGGTFGAMQPVASDDSRAGNAALGGAGGAGGVVAGRALDAGIRGGKALIEPFTDQGREQILARTLNRFAGDPAAAAKAMQNAPEFVPGSMPTVAEAADDAGLAGLQLAAANSDPKIKAELVARARQQNAARLSSLGEVAGAPGQKEFFEANRSQVAEELYKRAFAEAPDDTKWIKGEITKLMQRPAFGQALKDAQELAMNSGIKVSPKNPENATQILHFAKMALDDKIDAAVQSGNKNASRALIDTRDNLVSLMESKDFSPSYREARDTFRQMSKPINEMEMGEELRKKFTPALMDVAGVENPTRVNAEAFARAIREQGDDIDRILSPEAKAKVMGVAKDLGRKATAEDSAKSLGSTTAQNLSAKNLMRQVMGPLGLPESWAESTLALTAARPMQWGFQIPEAKLQDRLAQLLLDAKGTGKLMESARTGGLSPDQIAKRQELARLISAAQGVSMGAGIQSHE
jgi:hypothetical protein